MLLLTTSDIQLTTQWSAPRVCLPFSVSRTVLVLIEQVYVKFLLDLTCGNLQKFLS